MTHPTTPEATYALNDAPVGAPPPPAPDAAASLTGRGVTLQPLADAGFDGGDNAGGGDAGDTFAALYDISHGDDERESVWRYMPYGPFADADEMRRCYRDMAAGGDPLFYVVRHNEDGGENDGGAGAPGGIVSYLRIAPAAYGVEIGHIWHASNRQGGSANTEAAYLLMKNAFALGYRRVEWKCNALNEKSCRAALRLGFAFEGVFRQHAVFKGKNRDTAWFALIDNDWQAAGDNIAQWLTAAHDLAANAAAGGDNTAPAPGLAARNRPLVARSITGAGAASELLKTLA